MKKYVLAVLLIAVPWVFNAAMVADEVVAVQTITNGYKVDFTDPVVWKRYTRSTGYPETMANYINVNLFPGPLLGLGTLIECVPFIIREEQIDPFRSCSGIEYQKGARSLEFHGSASNIYGMTLTIVSPAANNPHLKDPYKVGFAFHVDYDYRGERSLDDRPKCTAKGGTLIKLGDKDFTVETLPAAKQTISFQCTHPVIYFSFQEAQYYFHPLSADGFKGYFYTHNVGPLIQQIEFSTVNPLGLSLLSNVLDQNGKVLNATTVSTVANQSVSFALGTYGSLVIKDNVGAVVPVKFTYNSSASFNPTLPDVAIRKGLFTNVVAVLFNGGVVKSSQSFMAVHMGQQSLLVTPYDSKYRPFTINLVVVKPSTLGAKDYDCTFVQNGVVYDKEYQSCNALIIEKSHLTGIPPQIIKAEIYQESRDHAFVKSSYRYEPMYDRAYFYNAAGSKKVSPFKNSIFYKKYTFSTTTHSLSAAAVSLRNIYKVVLPNGMYGFIPNNFEKLTGVYRPLKVWDIVDADINYGNNSQHFVRKNPDRSKAKIQPFIIPITQDRFDYVAQTVVSSSYGLMQVMYPTAVKHGLFLEFSGNYIIGRNPLELFRPLVNVSVGAEYLVECFKVINEKVNYNTKSFTTVDDFYEAFKNAYSGYNGGEEGFSGDRAQAYKDSVHGHIAKFWITQRAVYGQ